MTTPRDMNRILSILLLVLSVALGGFVAEASAQSCRSLSLTPEPYWVFSGAWSADGSSILLLDVARKSLLSYPVDGGPAAVVMGTGEADDSPENQLSLIQGDAGGFVLEGPNGYLQRLGPGLETVEELGWTLDEASREPGLKSLDSWAVSGDDILLYGDYRHFSGTWLSVFAKASLDDPDDLEILEWLPARHPARRFYLNAQQYLTTLNGKGYFLLQDDPVSVWEVDLLQEGTDSLRRLEGILPSQLSHRVDLPAPQGVDSVPKLYAAQKQVRSITALFGQGDHLYLLGREPDGSETRWSLTVVDPTSDRVVRTLYLPSRAPHLIVLPGPRYWAVVEKGDVEAFGTQQVMGARLLPSEWFSQPDSILTKPNATPICR